MSIVDTIICRSMDIDSLIRVYHGLCISGMNDDEDDSVYSGTSEALQVVCVSKQRINPFALIQLLF